MSDKKDTKGVESTDMDVDPLLLEENKEIVSKHSEKDFSEEVKVKIPEYTEAIKKDPASLNQGLELLLALEKRTRLGTDVDSTILVAKAIIDIIYFCKDWKALNEHITLLCKRRAQMTKVVLNVIRNGVTLVDETPDDESKIALLETLRTVSAGKMFVELERARMTRTLCQMKEAAGEVVKACDLLQEVQVETIGSMEIREKADFLLEQLRLCLAKKDYVRAEIMMKKINKDTINEEKMQDLKLKYYNLLIDFHTHESHYLDLCKAYREIFNTNSIQEDPEQWKKALKNAVIYLALAPFDSEVSDLLHRMKEEKKMSYLPKCKRILDNFTTIELMDWPLADESEWKAEEVFQESKEEKGEDRPLRWDDFQKRVVQHNLRVLSEYYTRITSKRLADLLQLDLQKTETYLSEMVSSKQLYAKIDRPKGIVTFQRKQSPDQMMNEWSSDIDNLLGLVEKTCHLIHKENMLYKIN